jgi:two-component system chemotaxis response regulator CheY
MAGKILVVDDSATARFMVANALKLAGYEVVEAEHGDDALAKLAEHADVKLVIADINMPWKDGIEMLKNIRSDAKLKATPVVFLTTEGNAAKIAEARALGISGYLVKPMSPQNLVAVAKKVVP